VARLRPIRCAKTLGFSLNESVDLLALRVDPETTREAVRKRAERKLAEVDAKIRVLEPMTGPYSA
jgi:MerR family transcriptional regulator, copper efflux regulator